ncbi:MAG: cation transporter, partial [Clostridia bacterium]|nr:cation transporter [Clostridia bacterium]
GVMFAFFMAVPAFVKFFFFFFSVVQEKKSDSSVIKVMKADSMLDFFITLTTLVSFTLTRYTEFAIDAVFGLAISIFITVGAIKMLKEAICGVLGLIKKEKREEFFAFLEEENITPEKTVFSIEEGEKEYAVVLLSTAPEKDEASLQELCKEKTGINLIFTINQNKGESQ